MSDQPLWSQPIENLAPEIQAGRLSPIDTLSTQKPELEAEHG